MRMPMRMRSAPSKLQIVKFARADLRGPSQMTALHLAASNGHAGACRLLLRAGARPPNTLAVGLEAPSCAHKDRWRRGA